jgi:hypothetical protein
MHYAAIGRVCPSTLFSAESRLVKLDGFCCIVDDKRWGQCVKTFGNWLYFCGHKYLSPLIKISRAARSRRFIKPAVNEFRLSL